MINAVRTKEALFTELHLGAPGVTDTQLIDAMLAHPVLINRPIVVTPLGTRLCRPSEQVLDILPAPQKGAFAKEDGEGHRCQRPTRLTHRPQHTLAPRLHTVPHNLS